MVSGSATLRQMHEPSMFLRCMARFAQKAPLLAPLSRPPWRIALSHAPSLDFLMRASLAIRPARPFWCGLQLLRAHSRCQGTLRCNAQTMARIPPSPAESGFRIVVRGSARLRQMNEPSMFLRCMARFAQKAHPSCTCLGPRSALRSATHHHKIF